MCLAPRRAVGLCRHVRHTPGESCDSGGRGVGMPSPTRVLPALTLAICRGLPKAGPLTRDGSPPAPSQRRFALGEAVGSNITEILIYYVSNVISKQRLATSAEHGHRLLRPRPSSAATLSPAEPGARRRRRTYPPSQQRFRHGLTQAPAADVGVQLVTKYWPTVPADRQPPRLTLGPNAREPVRAGRADVDRRQESALSTHGHGSADRPPSRCRHGTPRLLRPSRRSSSHQPPCPSCCSPCRRRCPRRGRRRPRRARAVVRCGGSAGLSGTAP